MSIKNMVAGAMTVWLISAAPSTFASDDPPPTVTITAVPASTVLSRVSAAGYASYNVTVKNTSDDKLNYLVFTANSSVVSTEAVPPAATFFASSGLPAPCVSTNAQLTAISCTLPPLPKYVGTVTFTIVFKSPTAGSAINLAGSLTYAEDAYHRRKTVLASASTGLDAPVADRVASYVPAGTGGAFPTGLSIGAGGIASATTADPWVTTVLIPTGPAATIAIQESTLLQSCQFTTCFQSEISIPNASFDHLTIYLTRDVSTLPRSKKDDDDDRYRSTRLTINNAVIRYEHTPGSGFVDVPNCADRPDLPLPQQPCIKTRTAFPKKAPTPLIDQGDWRFEIWALDNGRYTN